MFPSYYRDAHAIVVTSRAPRRWRELCRVLWYARGATAPIRRLARRSLGTRRPAWRWTGGAGIAYPRIEDLSHVIGASTGTVFGWMPRPNWRALAVAAAGFRT